MRKQTALWTLPPGWPGGENAGQVIPRGGHPDPNAEPGVVLPIQHYTALLSSDGTDSGSQNMAVNGSSIPSLFYLEANSDFTISIMHIGIVIVDDDVRHNRFGSIPAGSIVNGWDFFVQKGGQEGPIVSGAKTSGEIIVQTGANDPYGDGGTAFELIGYQNQKNAHTIPIG